MVYDGCMLRETVRSVGREKRTIRAMVGLYCRKHHGGTLNKGDRHLTPGVSRGFVVDGSEPVPFIQRAVSGLCGECAELLDYAWARLDRCPFGVEKTSSAKCPVHCYRPAMRARIHEVMRYAGPRMLLRHPILALRHQWDARRHKPRGEKQ